MKYFTKEWYEACQAADWCLNMAVSKNAEEFSEEYYKDLYTRRRRAFVKQMKEEEGEAFDKIKKKRRKIKESYKIRQRQHTTVKRSGFTEKCSEKESDHMMEDGNGRKKVWICLSIVVLAAVVIGAVYYMNMPKEHSEEGLVKQAL